MAERVLWGMLSVGLVIGHTHVGTRAVGQGLFVQCQKSRGQRNLMTISLSDGADAVSQHCWCLWEDKLFGSK